MKTVAYLLPERRHTTWNPALEPIYLRHEELQILGIVSGVIRQG